ncbi:MAG: response regulator transcription factor [Chloroflexi bacterium]|nr:response regulator transcription factor [Chloroflexota bacterium]
MMKRIRVLLAEDHNVVREGLRLLLGAQPDIEVVGEATTGREAVAVARNTSPDVAVLDISMPELDGLQAAVQIRRECPDTRILILSMHESDTYFFRALEAGAAGYVLKKAASDDLISALRAVNRGEAFFYPSLARKLLDTYLSQSAPDIHTGPPGYQELSEREREIMHLIVSGLSNQEIAERLIISASTVQTHRTNILHKLDIKTTIDLVRYAIRHGIIEA